MSSTKSQNVAQWRFSPTSSIGAEESCLLRSVSSAWNSSLPVPEPPGATTITFACDITRENQSVGDQQLVVGALLKGGVVVGVRIKTWTGFMPQVQGSPGIR